MNDDAGGRTRWPRWAGLLALAVGIFLMTAACGGSSTSAGSTGSAGSGGSPSTGASTTYQKEVAYAQCMRAHGVPNFPDPNGNGVFGIKNHSVDLQSAQVQGAQKTCRHLLPDNGQLTPAQQRQNEKQLLAYSQCMRAHGVKNFPDPSSNGQLKIDDSSGINLTSPQFLAAQRACQSLNPLGAAP